MKIKFFFLFVVIMVFTLFFFYVNNRYSFENELPYFVLKKNINNDLTVGIIGDSWAAGRKIDTLLANELYSKNDIALIYSSGNLGAKSKLIYQNIFNFGKENISSQFVINKQPNYCVVLAGVNDIQGELGQSFYAHHLVLIIKSLIHYNIKPIVLTIPRIGIDENSKEKSIVKKYRNKLFRKLFVSNSDDLFTSYHMALNDSLSKRNLLKDVFLINADSLHIDYTKNPNYFLTDAIHLSLLGKQILSKAISNIIVEDRRSNNLR